MSGQDSNQTHNSLLAEFGSYTTLHGFHFTIEKTVKVRRLLWGLLILGAAILLFYQLYYAWVKVVAFENVVQTTRLYEEKLDFPAISICSNNMMTKSKILGTDAQRYLDLIDTQKKGKWAEIEKEFNSTTFDVEEAVYKYGLNLSEAMKGCEYMNWDCAKEFTSFIEFRFGLCYTFNANITFEAINSGSSYGLSLTLDSQPEEYYGPFSASGIGYHVIVHDQTDHPSMERDGWEVMPGVSTCMKVTRKQIQSLEAPYKSNCTKNPRYKSESHCLQACYTNMAIRSCRCRILGMTIQEAGSLPWCSPRQIRDCIYLTLGTAKPSNCDCQVKCNRVKYDVQISSLRYPPDNFIDVLLEQRNISLNETDNYREWYRNRAVRLKVFYKEMTTEILLEKADYGLSDLAGDLGGNMGLFLGCSILTIFEFVDLLIIWCVMRCKKRHRDNRVHKPETNGTESWSSDI